MPPGLVVAAARAGLLSVHGAEHLARAMHSDEAVEALIGLADLVPANSAHRRELIENALTIATRRRLPKSLCALLPYLGDTERAEAVSAALSAIAPYADTHLRTSVIGILVSHLLPEQLPDAVSVALAPHEDDWQRAAALKHVLPRLSETERDAAIKKAIELAGSDGGVGAKARAFGLLAGHLSVPAFAAALSAISTAIKSFGAVDNGLEMRAWLALHQTENEIDEILSETIALRSRWADQTLRSVVGLLASRLSIKQLCRARERAMAIVDPATRGAMLARIVPHLPKADQHGVIDDLLDAFSWKADMQYSQELKALRSFFDAAQLDRAVLIARSIWDESSRIDAVRFLAPCLPPERRTEAVREAFSLIKNPRLAEQESARAWNIRKLAPMLSAAQLEEAVRIIRGLNDDGVKQRAFGEIATYLPPDILRDTLAAAKSIGDEADQAKAIVSLFPLMSEAKREQVLSAWNSFPGEASQAIILGGLASYISGAQVSQVLDIAVRMKSDRARVHLVRALADFLPEHEVERAVQAVRAIQQRDLRLPALSALAPRTTGDLGDGVRNELFAAARNADYTYGGAEVLKLTLCHLLEDQIAGVATVVLNDLERVSGWDTIRAETLVVLAPYLPQNTRDEWLTSTIEMAAGYYDEHRISMVINCVAPYLSAAQIELAVAVGEQMRDGLHRGYTLATLAPYIQPDRLPALVDTLSAIDDKTSRAIALSRLMPCLTGDLRIRALRLGLDVARDPDDRYPRASRLTDLIPFLGPEDRLRILNEALELLKRGNLPTLPTLHQATAALPSKQSDGAWSKAELVTLLRLLFDACCTAQREDAFGALTAAARISFDFGGTAAVDEMYDAVRDVALWYQ